MEAELFEGWPDSTDPDTNLTLILTYSSRTTAPTAQPTLELEFARNAQKREGGAASDMSATPVNRVGDHDRQTSGLAWLRAASPS